MRDVCERDFKLKTRDADGGASRGHNRARLQLPSILGDGNNAEPPRRVLLRINSNCDERFPAGVLANAVKLAVAFQGHPIPSIEREGNNLLLMFQGTDSVVESNGGGVRNLISLAGTQRACDPAGVVVIGVRRPTSTGRAPAVAERDGLARAIERFSWGTSYNRPRVSERDWLARVIEQRHLTQAVAVEKRVRK